MSLSGRLENLIYKQQNQKAKLTNRSIRRGGRNMR